LYYIYQNPCHHTTYALNFFIKKKKRKKKREEERKRVAEELLPSLALHPLSSQEGVGGGGFTTVVRGKCGAMPTAPICEG
jgi:hypothetical protein